MTTTSFDNRQVKKLSGALGAEITGVDLANAGEWHTDITFQKNPAQISILNMVTSPEVGGDTM